MRRWLGVLLLGCAGWAQPTPPPGPNVHLVLQKEGHTFWRGGGPRKATLEALEKAAQGHTLTLLDLRTPANSDDKSGKDGRLAPADEARWAKEHGFRYRAISAMDHQLVETIEKALQEGDVYMHCMYGVNRTGFAVGVYATARHLKVDRSGLGERDYNQGAAFGR